MDRSEESLAGVGRPDQPSEDAREHSGVLAERNGVIDRRDRALELRRSAVM